ncbi:nucleoside triphosphate pyrophosphohydrolase [Methylobacterium sp. W2]|uniref:nucleoside triphosphate pyrophosphohydrolase n=1 Tax=Methylobacterium sp. W2 TaxID=2598107 RepID=UPI001D0C5832|nr:nucleoside triphosphate pyrophosphohydrolase [Methylobacterium sp. W2]MCC0808996.1 nucleoside triphosphate pyrophosphohydrolase [Methylobacterium sp. W2]
MTFQQPIETLLRLMAALRDPERGCAWDQAQTLETLAPYTLEEAYEVVDAIERGDLDELKGELGDLLFQVVFQARVAEESGNFAFDDVVRAICDKMIRRHPHVFQADGSLLPDGADRLSLAQLDANWTASKAAERSETTGRSQPAGGDLLGSVAKALPALTRAEKISRNAARHGFDWPDAASVIAKIREEVDEVADALGRDDPDHLAEEIGDLLFAVVNLARHSGIDPEYSLKKGNIKFERRFHAMAALIGEDGASLEEANLPAMEAAWQRVKRSEA